MQLNCFLKRLNKFLLYNQQYINISLKNHQHWVFHFSFILQISIAQHCNSCFNLHFIISSEVNFFPHMFVCYFHFSQCKLSFLLTGTLAVKNLLPGVRNLGFKSWLCYFLVNALGKSFSLFCLNFLIYKINITIMFVELQYIVHLKNLEYFLG